MKKAFAAFLTLIALILSGCSSSDNQGTPNPTQPAQDYALIKTFEVEGQLDIDFRREDNGVSYVGTVTLPTPCHTLQTTHEVTGTNLRMNIAVNYPADNPICAQVIAYESISDTIVTEADVQTVTLFLNDENVN